MCDDSAWGIADAQVACRQLALPTTGATTLTLSAVLKGSLVNWLTNIRCVGNESSLFNCSIQPYENTCYLSQYAGVSCHDSKS